MYRPNSLWTWSFLGITLLQAIVIVALEAFVFTEFEITLNSSPKSTSGDQQSYTRPIPIYLALFVFGLLYQLVLVWDALRLKNTIQIIGLCLYNLGLLIYSSVQVHQIEVASNQLDGSAGLWETIRPYLIAIPCILALGLVLMSFVAWKLYDEFAWTIYKHISADLRMKRRYLTFQIYIMLLKFDFFFFLGFTLQFVVIVIKTYDVEFGLTVAAMPITIVILVLAAYWTRKENKFGMIIVILVYFAAFAYFIFKLNRMYNGIKAVDFNSVKISMTIFGVITVILIVITIAIAIQCLLNFGKGLKPHITSRKLENEDEKTYMTELPNLSHGPVPSRMTID